jgi:hypothetical protein
VGGWNAFDENREGIDTRFRGFSPNFAAATFPFAFGRVSGSVQVSYQRAVPFDGHRKVEEDTDDPDAPRYTDTDASGGFDAISFATGWSLSRKVRLGVSVNRWLNGYTQDRFLFRVARPRDTRAEWGLQGWNMNVGAIFSPTESLNLAVVANTPYTADIDLAKSRIDYQVDQSGNLVPVSQSAFESDDVTIDFPGAFGVGLSWRPQSQLTLSADYNRTLWSKAYIYNYFVVRVGDEGTNVAANSSMSASSVPPPADRVFPKLYYPEVDEVAQVDSEQIRFGAEYVFIFDKFKLPVRAGYFNDRQIVIDASGNAPRYHGMTAGTGIIVGPVLLDAAYLYEYGSYITSPNRQKVTQRMHRFLASLIYRFGGPS